MRIDEEKENLTEEQLRLDGGKARFKELSRAEFDYQEKRAEAFSRMRYGINYAKIFFTSDKVVKRIRAYLQLYEKIRTNKIQWGPNAFDQILIKGKELTTSMEEELKERTGL